MTTWRCASWISGCDSVKYTNGLFDAVTALSVQRNAWAKGFAHRFPEAIRMTTAQLVIDCSTMWAGTHLFCDAGNFSREERSLEWSRYECTFPAYICTTQISMYWQDWIWFAGDSFRLFPPPPGVFPGSRAFRFFGCFLVVESTQPSRQLHQERTQRGYPEKGKAPAYQVWGLSGNKISNNKKKYGISIRDLYTRVKSWLMCDVSIGCKKLTHVGY